MSDEVQRALGRIEGMNTQILERLDKLGTEFGDHRNEDQRNFSSVRKLLDDKINAQNDLREAHLGQQDNKLDRLQQEQDRARGAGWVIISLLGALATFLGGAVIAALGGHIKFG